MTPQPTNELWEQLDRVRQGWVDRIPSRPGEACALAFVDNDGHSMVVSDQARRTVRAVIHEQYGVSRDPGHWNDAPGRTQSEVEAVLEKAALRLDEQLSLAPSAGSEGEGT